MLTSKLLKNEKKQINWPFFFKKMSHESVDYRLKNYYSKGIILGTTPIYETPLIALDIETTGLDYSKDGIVSIGIVPIKGRCILSSQSRHWIIKPQVELNSESVTFHGITHSQIENAPYLSEVLDDFLTSIAGHVIVVHCAEIERSFFKQALLKCLNEYFLFPVIDTMALEARIHRNTRFSLWESFFKKKKKSIRLADSRERYGLPRYHAHHALTDALASAELLQAQILKRFSSDTVVQDLWC